jgi:hypothetical protein
MRCSELALRFPFEAFGFIVSPPCAPPALSGQSLSLGSLGHFARHMNTDTRDTALRVFFRCYQAVGLAVGLAIPAILIYKFTQGVGWLLCLALLVAYLGSFAATIFLMIRVKRLDPVWCTLFGVCFLVLLFFSLRL